MTGCVTLLPPRGRRRARAAFTLVELMIVVAIIGILAAIAIPSFVAMQLKTKRAEMGPFVNAISDGQVAYHAATDEYVEEPNFVPASQPGKQMEAWPQGTAFDTLGWQPDGLVRGRYKTEVVRDDSFTVTAETDVDGNGAKANYLLVYDPQASGQPISQGLTTPSNVY